MAMAYWSRSVGRLCGSPAIRLNPYFLYMSSCVGMHSSRMTRRLISIDLASTARIRSREIPNPRYSVLTTSRLSSAPGDVSRRTSLQRRSNSVDSRIGKGMKATLS